VGYLIVTTLLVLLTLPFSEVPEGLTAPLIEGTQSSGEVDSRERTFSSGQACPHGLKEKTNREKTKVATMVLE
jgi:hypothetical protein